MTILSYRDFEGSAVVEDGRIVIQVLHIDDFVTAECDKASDARETFERLVQDYLDTCAAIGKTPRQQIASGA